MRLLLTGGGTGGHVYPALVVLDWLRKTTEVEATWVGSQQGIERDLVARSGIEYAGLPAGALRGRGPVGIAHGLLATVAGVRAAHSLLGHHRPDVVLATGGYVSTPAVLAARLRRIPVVVYLPDVVPGWAVRALGRIANVVATTSPEARRHLPGARVVVTGYPVRPGFLPRDAAAARRRFGLDPCRFTVTVAGGSLGATRLNDAIAAELERLLAAGQVIHLTGRADFERIAALRDGLPSDCRDRYYPAAYLDAEMPEALSAANLIVSRAGASVLGEYPAVGRGSLLVPGPFSSQLKNATYLERLGAAEVLPNERAAEIPDRVLNLSATPELLRAMADAAAKLSRPAAAADLGRLLIDLAGRR
ncbi:MAG: UDP-N-acetylglucosamine--N-acetylmuramyl-(pentapeptide) pyrophosphoryl-undecaprenol N-acetylglucosamine transferase [Dehalococcoidia bacterium]